MTKAATKAAARRRKKRPGHITLPGGDIAPQRPAQGQGVAKEPADAVALAARAQMTGLEPDKCRDPRLGCAVGRRLMREALPDLQYLWESVCHLRRVWAAYSRAIGAPARHPRSAQPTPPPDRAEAFASMPIDLRPKDEADRAAVAAYMRARVWIEHADRRAQSATIRAVIDEPDQPLADWSGIVLALRCVADGLAGRQITPRVRKSA